MFCPNCGTFNDDYSTACQKCGTQFKMQPSPQPAVQPMQYQQSPYAQPSYAQSPYAQQGYQPNRAPMTIAGLSKVWYFFMANIGFFATAGGLLLLAIGFFLGWQYGTEEGYRYVDMVSNRAGGIRVLDTIMGVLFIALAHFAVAVGLMFRKYKEKVAKMTYFLYGGFIGLYLLYHLILCCFSFGVSYDTLTDIYPLAFPIILLVTMLMMLGLNVLYFVNEKVRKEKSSN